jgi:hypothetical protein
MADDPKWMEHASARMKSKGTVGSFSRAAKKAGMSTSAFAHKEKGAGGKMGRKANFALNASKAKH